MDGVLLAATPHHCKGEQMTPERAKEMLPILQAYADGKQTQYRVFNNAINEYGPWYDNKLVGINFGAPHIQYRIKPDTLKYRRYLYNSGVRVTVCTLNGHPVCTPPDTLEKVHSFVRLIDTEWQEVEVCASV
jgi:hypothetical protein